MPASSAEQPLFDGVYLRIGARDDMWTGRSTLMVEVQSIQAIKLDNYFGIALFFIYAIDAYLFYGFDSE